ncbi:MAG TPA: HEAT repeat domain-containing protein [Polyangiaceae bacterium]|nr:HEAT repeat domain-containing protein [Polyangiaceae bacterium]
MIRPALRFLATGVLLCATALPVPASAQGRVDYFVEQLKSASDFRVRTQAALALGASQDPSAVGHLCEALDDSSDAVRTAAAAGLGKLKNPAGLSCLKSHAGEVNAAVRSVIERSTEALSAGGKPGKPPPPKPNDSFYVAIGPITDKSGRSDKSVPALVAAAMQDKLLATRGYAVAPQGETSPAAKKIMKQRGLKGYFLQTRVEPPQSNGDDLTIQVRVTMWTYPSKALQGEFAPKMTMSGASAGDVASEDSLIKMAIERAVDSFVQVAASQN